MDIQKPSNARAKKIKRGIYAAIILLFVAGTSIAVSRLRPAGPTVDRSTISTGEVKRGGMLRDVHGVGTLVPEDIRWIAAQTDSRVDRIVLRPGALVKPDSIILELSNPSLQRDTLDAEYQLKAAAVHSDYEQAKLQHEVDEKLRKEGIGAEVTAQLSEVKSQQLGVRAQLEDERTKNAADSAGTRLLVQQTHVDQQRALYNLRRGELDALHVRAGIEGVLQVVPVEVGQHVTPGINLCRVADPKRLKAEIKIAETQAKDVAIGQKASVDTRN